MIRYVVAVLLTGVFTSEVFSQATFTSIASGNWNGGLTVWSVTGFDADNIPDVDDDVIISTSHTISINVNAACNTLTLNGTANLNFNTNNRTLNVNGLMTMNGNSQVSGNNNSRILNLNSNFLIPAGQTGSIGGVQVVQSAPNTFTISGTFTPTSATGTKNLGDVIINSTGTWNATSNEAYTINNLTLFNGAVIGGSATSVITANGNLTVFPSSPGLRAQVGRITLTINGTTTILANGYFEFAESNVGTKTFNNTITVNLGGTWDNTVGEDPVVNCSIVNNGVWPVPTGGTGRYDVSNGGSYTYSGNAEIGMTRLRLRNASTVTNTGTLRLTRAGGQNLSVESGSTFINGNGTSGYLIMTGDGNVVDVTGAFSSVDFSAPNNIVEYSGAVNQTIYPTIYHHINAFNGATKTINGTTTVNGNFTITGTTVVNVAGGNDLIGPGNLIMTGTSRLRISSAGTVPALTGTGHSLASGTTIELYRGGPQTAASSTLYPYQNLDISGATGSAVNMSAVTTIAQDFIIRNQGTFNNNAVLTVGGTFNYTSSGASTLANDITVGNFIFQNGQLDYSSRTITINGNDGTWTFNGGGGVLTTNATSRVVFTSGTNQRITGSAVTTFSNLEINNLNNVSLDGVDANVATGLTFTNGNLITGTNVLICTNSAVTVTPSNGFVEGNFRKPVIIGAPVVTFEVGTGTTYSPAVLTFSGVTTAGNFTVSALAGDHPDILGSNIEPNRSVNRHWAVTNNATTFTNLPIVIFNFGASDLDPLADFSNFSVRRYNGIDWGNTTTGIRTATSTQITGEASTNLPNGQIRFYQIGELIPTSGAANRLTGTQNWSNPATWIQNRTGAVQFTAGSATVTGVGTLFTTELVAGDVLMLQTSPGTVRGTVQTIIDDETLTLTAAATATVNGGYGRQYVPNTINDQVVIGNSNISPDAATTIILDMNATVNSLDINTVASPRATAQTLTHSGANTLTVQTNVRVNHPAVTGSPVTNVWNINAGTATVGGNVVIGSGTNNANTLARINITTGILNVGSNLVFNTSNNANRELTAVLDMAGGNGRINLSGQLNFTNNRGLLLSGTSGSVFNYNRTSGGQTIMFPTANSTPWVYHNLYLNNTSPSGINLFGGITASNVTGDVRVQSGTFYVGNASITGNASRTFQVASGATFRMEGNQPFPTGFGVFDLGTTSPFGTVIYQQSNDQNIANHTYGNLILRRNGRTYSIPNTTITVAGNLTIGDGSASVTLQDLGGGGSSGLLVGGNLTITSGARLRADNNQGIPTITVGGNWVNNSTAGASNGFDEGTGTVIFNSPSGNTLQTIGGSTAETFYNLTINTSDATDVVRILNNTNVSNQLNLQQGELDLNALTLYVTNPAVSAVNRTGGYIKSENNTSPYGTLRRHTGTTTGSFLFPFGKSSTEYIPFTMNITSAGSPATGSVSVSTYATGTDNTPYPDGVTNLNGTSGGLSVADRFWVITLNNYTVTRPTATLTFTATAAEIATTGATTLNAQRWAPSNTWEPALPGQTYNPVAGTVTVPNVNQYSPWAIADIAAPLPVELKSFELVAHADFVEVNWSTASELNNDYFTVERRHEHAEQFEALASIPGAGTTNVEQRYRYEDYAIAPGTWYYRIKQTDFDGSYSYSPIKSVTVSGKGFWQVYPNPSEGSVLNIRFTAADFNKTAIITVLDAQGKRMHMEQVSVQGLDVPVRFTQQLPSGVYLVIIRTADDVVRHKWIVR